MSAILLDGKSLALKKQQQLLDNIVQLKQAYGVEPCLVVLLTHNNVAGQIYTKSKERIAQKIGVKSIVEILPETITQEEMIQVIEKYNADDSCHGILVQLPLPSHLDAQKVLHAIDYKKDMDGFHPMNIGNFFLGNEANVPCTPAGIIALLDEYNIDCTGKKALIIGRSNIVGKPMGLMLLQKNATVTYAHTQTTDLVALTKKADIIVVSAGSPNLLQKEHVKEGVIVIDVGTNRLENNEIVGDVSKDVCEVASYLTPVPGGVGPMTITILMEQTYKAALKACQHQ